MQNRSPTHQERTLQFTHSAATTAMTPVVINSKVYLPLGSAGANELNAYLYAGEVSNAVANAPEVWNLGDKLYWDAANSRLTTTSAGNTVFGYALEAKVSADTVSGLVAYSALT